MTIENPVGGGESAVDRPAPFRYGVVFLLTVALVVFVIAAPSANWSRAMALAIEGVALVVAIATGRARKELRYRRAVGVGVAIVLVVAGVWIGIISHQLTSLTIALVTAAVPVAIVGGLLRLLRERGVTLQAVAGALAITSQLGSRSRGSLASSPRSTRPRTTSPSTRAARKGDRVYFSFTVLTTTGFVDFSAATPVGHALAVIEMLTGQFYLVTVIGC
ncbi:MAG: ion channel [Solirubrobacteraceae bacterium]